MKFRIETQPGYGTKQRIMPRFYMQMKELCSYLGVEPFIDAIPNKFLQKIIDEYRIENKTAKENASP